MIKRAPKRTFSEEFKLEAVRLSEKPGVSTLSVARDLGIDAKILYRWRRKLLKELRPGGSSAEELEALRRAHLELQKENRKLLEERAILKKAIRYFATEEE